MKKPSRLTVPLLHAAEVMDWQQVVFNGGPPCFHLCENGRFCGRAERWAGHQDGDPHKFVSLRDLLVLVRDCHTYQIMEGTKKV